MLKKIAVCGLSILLLVGCDDTSKVQVGIDDKESQKAEAQTSNTVIYLPGGAGVDFGRKATGERINTTTDGRKVKILSYGFTETADEVDASLAKVLQAEGYVRSTPPADNVVLNAAYKKNDYPYISARYLKQKTGAIDKKTTLVLSWEIKP